MITIILYSLLYRLDPGTMRIGDKYLSMHTLSDLDVLPQSVATAFRYEQMCIRDRCREWAVSAGTSARRRPIFFANGVLHRASISSSISFPAASRCV